MSDKPTVVELLLKVMADVQAVKKGDRNREQGYNFRGIDAVVNAVGPLLRKHGVLPMPMLQEASYRDVLTTKEKRSRECTVKVAYRFYGPSGDFVEAVVPGESMDFGDKGAAKAMSVAYRIVLLQALCIPTDEPEPDAQTYERAHRGEWEQAAKPPTPEEARNNWLANARASADGANAEQKAHILVRAQQAAEHGVITAADLGDLTRELRAEQGDRTDA